MTKQELIDKIEKLKKERDELNTLANIQDLKQHAYKIFLNSSYGVLGSVFYSCFDIDNAEAVTLTGQTIIREMVQYTNEILNNLVDSGNEEYVIAGDTDSFSKDSIICVDGHQFTVEDLFELILSENEILDKLANGTEVAVVNNLKHVYLTQSINGMTSIKNVSRHKITKDRWKICTKDNPDLYITSDHSIIVYRDGELIECKPSDIKSTDYLVIGE